MILQNLTLEMISFNSEILEPILVFEEEITKQELLKSIEEEGVKFNEEI